jgi:hypothetical protein
MSRLLYSSTLGIEDYLDNEIEIECCTKCNKDFQDLKSNAKITVHRYYPCKCKKYDFLIPEFENSSYIWE